MIACSEAVRQLWEYLDGVAEEPDRARIQEHLAFCRRCCGELEFVQELRAVLAGPVATELPGDVRRRLTKTLDDLEEPWLAT